MKKSVALRILLGICGLVFVAESAALVADKFFNVPVFRYMDQVSPSNGTVWLAAVMGCAAISFMLGILCWISMLHRGNRKQYVQQNTESGTLDISMAAIETLVKKCTDCHEDIQIRSTHLENSRNGLIIRLKACLASGVNIPLTVSGLQKQIRQYVTACSGIDVKEVAVVIEQTDGKPSAESFMVPDPDVSKVIRDPDPAPLNVVIQDQGESSEERLLHQRLFGHQEVEASLPENPAGMNPIVEEDTVESEDAADAETPAENSIEPEPECEQVPEETTDTENTASTESDSVSEEYEDGELDWTLDDSFTENSPDESENDDGLSVTEDTETDEEQHHVT